MCKDLRHEIVKGDRNCNRKLKKHNQHFELLFFMIDLHFRTLN